MFFKPRFSYAEKAILDALKNGLEEDYRLLLATQVDSVTKIQRLDNGKEVDCYCMRWGKPYQNPAIRLPIQAAEVKFASVRITGSLGRVLNAGVNAVNGYFFSINFDRSPREIDKSTDVEVRILSTYFDLPVEGRATAKSVTDGAAPATWASQWLSSHRASQTTVLLKEQELVTILAKVEIDFPTDNVELMRQANGFTVGDINILGLSDVYDVDIQGHQYIVVAIVGGDGVVAARKDETPTKLFYIPYDGGQSRDLGDSTRSAIDALMNARMHDSRKRVNAPSRQKGPDDRIHLE
jgi:hypothetical protein